MICSNTSIIIYNIILYRHSSLLYLLYVESPYGILPVLHTEGKVLSGNGNIARYLAEKFGEFVILFMYIYLSIYLSIQIELAGGNALENAELYGIIDVMEDLWGKINRNIL